MIRKAVPADLDGIMNIIQETIKSMKASKNYQWDSTYPLREDFEGDIADENLYILDAEDGKMCGLICINFDEPEEYRSLSWTTNKRATVLHRMVVSVDCRGKGIATQLMKFAEEQAVKNKTMYLKSDTYSTNTNMIAVFEKLNYNKIDEMSYQGREFPFYCYEKRLR